MRETIEAQLKRREMTVPEGETPLRYRDVQAMYNADQLLANKALPTKESRIHVARCARALKPFIEERDAERAHIQRSHAPAAGQVLEDGEKMAFRDPIGMSLELAELDEMVVFVKLPSPIKPDMLPTNSKANPNNEDGLAAILADLGPLYPIDEE